MNPIRRDVGVGKLLDGTREGRVDEKAG